VFSTGYLEYYPFVAVGFLAALMWTASAPLSERSPIWIGVVVAALPLMYVGFGLIAGVVLIFYVWRQTIPRVKLACAAAALTFCGIVVICWPGGIAQFLKHLNTELNFGERNTTFALYQGHAAGSASIFFSMRYALSRAHLKGDGWMWFWGCGFAVPAVLTVAAVRAVVLRRRERRPDARDRGLFLAATLATVHLAYALMMIP